MDKEGPLVSAKKGRKGPSKARCKKQAAEAGPGLDKERQHETKVEQPFRSGKSLYVNR